MRNWTITFINISFLIASGSVYAESRKPELIRSQEDAVAIAIIVVRNVYGGDVLNSQLPLVASSKNKYWVVTGTLHAEKGGVAEIWISKVDARVIKYIHGE